MESAAGKGVGTSARVLGLVPARAGSKGVPGKNVRPLAGKPLIVHTLEAALRSRRLIRVVLSTDSAEMEEIGRSHGVDVPFRRPAELGEDQTPMAAVIRHALDWLAENDGFVPEIVVLLQPTSPFREASDIDGAVELLEATGADSVVSVARIPPELSGYWQFSLVEGRLEPLMYQRFSDLPSRRQALPPTYVRNGAVYAFRRESLERHGTLYGLDCRGYEMPAARSVNIDSRADWDAAEEQLAGRDVD